MSGSTQLSAPARRIYILKPSISCDRMEMMRPLFLFCGLVLFSIAALGGLVVLLNARVPQTVVAPVPTTEPPATPTPMSSGMVAAAPIPEATMEAVRKSLTTRAKPEPPRIIQPVMRRAPKNLTTKQQLPTISSPPDIKTLTPNRRRYNLTAQEVAYLNNMGRIMSLAINSMRRLSRTRDESTFSQAKAEANAAWQMQMTSFFVPPRFQLADSYFSQGLSKLRLFFLELDMLKNGMGDKEATKADIIAAKDLLIKSSLEAAQRMEETAIQ